MLHQADAVLMETERARQRTRWPSSGSAEPWARAGLHAELVQRHAGHQGRERALRLGFSKGGLAGLQSGLLANPSEVGRVASAESQASTKHMPLVGGVKSLQDSAITAHHRVPASHEQAQRQSGACAAPCA